MPLPHEQGPCGDLNHTYRNYMILWCPHRQQFTVTSSAYLETGTEADPVDFSTRRVELGPFDSASDVSALLATWVAEDLGHGAG